tara:strand:+ start:204 stop:938 length:735 start_codon:yes stop_codon:yes gene_type:complete
MFDEDLDDFESFNGDPTGFVGESGFIHKKNSISRRVIRGGLTGGLSGALGGLLSGGGGGGGSRAGGCVGPNCGGPDPAIAAALADPRFNTAAALAVDVPGHIQHGHIPGTALGHPAHLEFLTAVVPGGGVGNAIKRFVPGGESGMVAGGGMVIPEEVLQSRLECPTFANGKTGILWMRAMTGEVVCLPRGVNGAGFGLVRKNKPRKKAFITAAEKASLSKRDALGKKAREFAKLTGQTCAKRGR